MIVHWYDSTCGVSISYVNHIERFDSSHCSKLPLFCVKMPPKKALSQLGYVEEWAVRGCWCAHGKPGGKPGGHGLPRSTKEEAQADLDKLRKAMDADDWLRIAAALRAGAETRRQDGVPQFDAPMPTKKQKLDDDDAHWRDVAERLWPGASSVLFGSPAFQVRALLAGPSAVESPLCWIDPQGLSTQDAHNCVLLEMRQAGTVIWRFPSKIEVIKPVYNYHGYEEEERASFNMPLAIAELLESSVVSWWKSAGDDWPPTRGWFSTRLTTRPDLTPLTRELTVWLQVWYPTGCALRVIQPNLQLAHVAWEHIVWDDSSCMEIEFAQDFCADFTSNAEAFEFSASNSASLECVSSVTLKCNLWRKPWLNGPLKVDVELVGDLDDSHSSFLTSGYLSKLKSVCS